MAHIITLTDGTNTVTFQQASGYLATGYQMDTADGNPDSLTLEITETLNLLLIGTNGPNLQSLNDAVESLFVAARRRTYESIAPRVFITLQVDGEANAWRAEIIDGRWKPDRSFLDAWYSNTASGQLYVTHRPWEGAYKELQLSSATQGTPATGGRTVTNGANNWVQVDSAQVNGVLPALVELQLTNTSGVAVGYRNFYLSVNATSDPANFSHIVEGEAYRSGFGTTSTGSGNSGNAYNHYTFTNTGQMQWDLSASLMQKTRGRTFRLLARLPGWGVGDVYVRPVLLDSFGLITLDLDDEIHLPNLANPIIDLGELSLPNGAYYTGYGGTVLGLQVRASGAASVDVDFIQLTALDSYQTIAQRGYSIVNNGTIFFNNIENIFHTGGATIFTPLTGPLTLLPRATQRIHIMYDEGTNMNVSRSMSVRAFIRERRLTV